MTDKTTAGKCLICGRFKRAIRWTAPDTGKVMIVRYQCAKVESDGEGGYEHD